MVTQILHTTLPDQGSRITGFQQWWIWINVLKNLFMVATGSLLLSGESGRHEENFRILAVKKRTV